MDKQLNVNKYVIVEERKKTQVAALLLKLTGGKLLDNKLYGLLYYIDKRAIDVLGRPVTFDKYFAFRACPFPQDYSLLLTQNYDSFWLYHIEGYGGVECFEGCNGCEGCEGLHEKRQLIKDPGNDKCSPEEIDIIVEIFEAYKECGEVEMYKAWRKQIEEWGNHPEIEVDMTALLKDRGRSKEEIEKAKNIL